MHKIAGVACFVVGYALHALSRLNTTAPRKVPVIFDNDGNYDDMLALSYLAKSNLVDIKAITVASCGFGTEHGGPPNMQRLARAFGCDAPVAYGYPASLSPIATFPLQWRIELDEFMDNACEANEFMSNQTVVSSTYLRGPELMAKVLRESDVPINIISTGPQTNLAAMLEKYPELGSRIGSIFMMGTAYKSPNNVYDWQMTFNGIVGACTEDSLPESPAGCRPHGC